jgi:hypothetical protein
MIEMDEDLNPIFSALEIDLVEWVRSNPKTCKHVTGHNSRYMFIFNNKGGLTIDLNRFNEDYYREVFTMSKYKRNRKAFVHKTCLIMRDTLIRIKKYEITLSITLKHWNTIETNKFYIHPKIK